MVKSEVLDMKKEKVPDLDKDKGNLEKGGLDKEIR